MRYRTGGGVELYRLRARLLPKLNIHVGLVLADSHCVLLIFALP
jgi:hypothetical protein